MTRHRMRPGWIGVVGGLGPLVSAEFLKTIYEESIRGPEQDSPRVMLYSDPTFPDRTTAFLAGETEPILGQLVGAIESLQEWGASQVVICCVTMHYLLPQLPPHVRGSLISLIDVVVDALSRSSERHLLLCTTGTRRLGTLERHERWSAVSDKVVYPSDADQEAIHRMIYELKANASIEAIAPMLDALLGKYGVGSFIAGCTEMHFFTKKHQRSRAGGCIDPLLIVAREVGAAAAPEVRC